MITRLRRLLTPLVCVAALVLLARYWWYRQEHIVASHAFVRGAVVVIGAPMDNQVAVVDVHPGQRVAEGQVLLRFNQTRQLAELERARAAHAEATLRVDVERKALQALERKVVVLERELRAQLDVQEAEARAAAVAVQLADTMATRTAGLKQAGVASQADADQAQATQQSAVQNAQRAAGRLAVASAERGRVDVERANLEAATARLRLLEAAAETVHAAVKYAEAELELTQVRAAKAGVVSRRLVEPGAAVRVGGPVLELWYDEGTSIEAWIDESNYADLFVGSPAEVVLAGLDEEVLEGHVEWLGVVTEGELREASFSLPIARMLAKSRWVRVGLRLSEPNPRLLPGLTAQVSVRRGAPVTPPPAPAPAPRPEIEVTAVEHGR